MITAPDWSTPPPPEAVSAVFTAAQHAADLHPELAAVAIAECEADNRWLAIAAVGLLGSLLRHHVATPDALRAEVLRIAAESDASDYMVTASLEAVAMAEKLEQGDLLGVHELCSGSQISVLDHANAAAAIAGQTIAALGGDTQAVFDLMRTSYGIGGAL